MSEAYRTAPIPTTGMPPGIPYIIGNELAERFSYYGMRAVLMPFMMHQLVTSTGLPDKMTEEGAAEWMHYFMAAVYITPLMGGLLADLWLGKYRTIILLSLVYCLGHLMLAIDHTRTGLMLGLGLIALGAGGIKPCVSSHVGDQFGTANAGLIPKAFFWFYFSINTGSFFSMLLTPYLLEHAGPKWAFGVPGILMFVATLVFWMGRRKFAHIPAQPRKILADLALPVVQKSFAGLLVIYALVAVFWALFDQTASRWVAQAEHMNRNVFGLEVLPAQMQSVNAILVLVMIPLFSMVIYPFVSRFVTVTPLRKISAGFFVAIPSFVIPAWVESQIISGATPTIWWQVLAYFFMTAAEVMISITCLDFSYTQAPKRLKSFVMALFFSSVFLGNIFTAAVNGWIVKQGGESALSGAGYYWFFVKCLIVTGVLFTIVAYFYKGQTFIQDEEEETVKAEAMA